MGKETATEGMAPPSDAITVTHKAQLPEVFKQDNRIYFRDNMPNNPGGVITVWFQIMDPIEAERAIKLRAEKLAFEADLGYQVFI